MDTKKKKRIIMTILGQSACGVSGGLFKTAALGVDPFLSFMSGIDELLPLSFGTVWALGCALLLLFTFRADRRYIGLGTLFNLFFMGYITEFTIAILKILVPEPSMILRILLLAAGIILTCISAAFYYTAEMGVSAYDSVALILSGTWHLGPFRICRILCDLVCVIGGASFFLLSGKPLSALPTLTGIGTIIAAFFMGPLIDFFEVHWAKPYFNN